MSNDYGSINFSSNSPAPGTTAFRVDNINANSANTDVGMFNGLPSRYLIRSVVFLNPSAAMNNASFDLMPQPGGAGDKLINSFIVGALTSVNNYVFAALATMGGVSVRSESSLYLRNIIPEGSNQTLSVILNIQAV